MSYQPTLFPSPSDLAERINDFLRPIEKVIRNFLTQPSLSAQARETALHNLQRIEEFKQAQQRIIDNHSAEANKKPAKLHQ